MLVVEKLVKRYPKRGSKEKLLAVDQVSFEIEKGEIFALLGPNGAGKTTTIKCICGLVIPDEGEIKINGFNLFKERSKALSQVSVVLEGNRNLYWRMTPLENMMYFAGIRGKKLTRSDALRILERLGIAEKSNELVHKLSRGMQQRTAIAVCLAAGTDILILDEPTLGLDVNSSVEFRSLINSLRELGKTILLSTHDMALVEAVADRVAIMNNGKIVVCEEKKKLLNLFNARRYKIRVIEKDHVLEKLREFGFSEYKQDGNLLEITVDLQTSNDLYETIDFFKTNGLEIESIEKEFVNFEKIFMSFTANHHASFSR